jgi:hypothetical protein
MICFLPVTVEPFQFSPAEPLAYELRNDEKIDRKRNMTPTPGINPKQIAFYDPERKGMFIHIDQLADSPFNLGDRFSLRRGKRELFAMTIIKDDLGDIFFDKKGIFIERSRKIDVLLGGIFDEYVFYIEPEIPGTIKIKPLEIVKDTNWRNI